MASNAIGKHQPSTGTPQLEIGELPSVDSNEVVYKVQTSFKDMHIPTFLTGISAFYFVEQILTHPTDVIRTRLQVGNINSNWRVIKNLIHEHGLRGLYIGFLPATIGHLPGSGIYLMTYAYMKDRLQTIENNHLLLQNKKVDGYQSPWISCTSAIIADLVSVSVYCPVDVVIQRLYLQSPSKRVFYSVMNTCKLIWQRERLKGFYKGVGPVLINSLPASAIWWTVYEHFKTVFSRIIEVNELDKSANPPTEKEMIVQKHTEASLFASGIAGIIVTLVTNPLDVIRTRLQVAHIPIERNSLTHPNIRTKLKSAQPSAFQLMKELYVTRGIRGFTKGIGPRLAQSFLFSTISALGYEFVVDLSSSR